MILSMSEKEVGQNNPLSTTQAQLEVTRTTLSALITSREASARQYPAVIGEILNGVVFATLTRPVLRLVQREQPRTNVSINNRIAGDIRRQSSAEPEQFAGWRRRLHSPSKRGMVCLDNATMSTGKKTPKSKRRAACVGRPRQVPNLGKAKRKAPLRDIFSATYGSTPWGVPGRMKDGQNLLSKRVLDWIARRGGQDIQSALKRKSSLF